MLLSLIKAIQTLQPSLSNSLLIATFYQTLAVWGAVGSSLLIMQRRKVWPQLNPILIKIVKKSAPTIRIQIWLLKLMHSRLGSVQEQWILKNSFAKVQSQCPFASTNALRIISLASYTIRMAHVAAASMEVVPITQSPLLVSGLTLAIKFVRTFG